VLLLWLSPWSALSSFYMSPHCDLSSHNLCNVSQCSLYYFSVAYLVLYGIDSAFLVSIVVIPSSHNIVTSLCCYSVDHFILVVAILKYDYKPVLNTIVIKSSVVGSCKP
jgi:hypothetical protein